MLEPDSAFAAASAPSKNARVQKGVVVCRVSAVQGLGTLPDLAVHFTTSRQGSTYVLGPDDSGQMTFSVPLVDLEAGDTVELTVWDRDVLSGDDLLGRGSATFQGAFPLAFAWTPGDNSPNDHVSGSCGELAAQAVATRLAQRLADVDQRLVAAPSSFRADPTRTDCGYPEALDKIKHAIEDAAAHGGWMHPEVRVRVSKFQQVEDAWKGVAEKAVAELYSRLPAPGAVVPAATGPIKLTVLSGSCGGAGTCWAKVEIDNPGEPDDVSALVVTPRCTRSRARVSPAQLGRGKTVVTIEGDIPGAEAGSGGGHGLVEVEVGGRSLGKLVRAD